MDHLSVLAELKRNITFTLKKDYDGIISRIKDGNSALWRLTRQNNDLESSRRSRSQAKVARLIRRLSNGVFNAMQNALTCRCIPKHNVGLELVLRNAVMVPGNFEDHVARKIDFNVMFGSQRQQAERWDSLRIYLSENKRAT